MLRQADGHGLLQTWGRMKHPKKNETLITPPLSWGHTSSPGLAKQPFGWCLRHFRSPQASLLSRCLWSRRTGRTEGRSRLPLPWRRWPTASPWGRGHSATTLNQAPAPGRNGGTSIRGRCVGGRAFFPAPKALRRAGRRLLISFPFANLACLVLFVCASEIKRL